MNLTIKSAVEHLQNGRLVAFPTETVYGLGADATNADAIRKIFELKGRPNDHPLIIHVANIELAMQYAFFSSTALKLAERCWPGPLTLILEKTDATLSEVTGNRSTVGIRIPDHPIALELLQELNRPIAAPSANPFGTISSTTAEHVHRYFENKILILDGGPCRVGIESTIVDLSCIPAILRPGVIESSLIEDIVGPLGTSTTAAPGRLEAHYAPRTQLILSDTPEKTRQALISQGKRVALLTQASPQDYARNLYAELHRLDSLNFDVLVAPRASQTGIGIAINDRLQKAANGSKASETL